MKEQNQKISNGKPAKKVCPDHGEYQPETYEVKYGSVIRIRETWCPICDDLHKKEQQEEKQKEDAERLEKRLEYAGITKRFKNCSFENFKITQSNKFNLDTISRYLNKFDSIKENGTSLIFCGKPGTGKTHLACALVSELTKNDNYVLYTTIYKMIGSIKATYNKFEDETEGNLIKKYTTHDLLIVDEIGVQLGSETEKVLFYQIINGRYENMLPTILISNLNEAGVKDSIGDRCFDRLREGNGAVLSFNWESYRK